MKKYLILTVLCWTQISSADCWWAGNLPGREVCEDYPYKRVYSVFQGWNRAHRTLIECLDVRTNTSCMPSYTTTETQYQKTQDQKAGSADNTSGLAGLKKEVLKIHPDSSPEEVEAIRQRLLSFYGDPDASWEQRESIRVSINILNSVHPPPTKSEGNGNTGNK